MDQLQPSPLHTQAEHRPTVASKIAATLFTLFILIFAVISTHLVWANPDMEIQLRLLLTFLVGAFTLTTLAALAGGRQ
jgi:hypothetical protein